MARLSTGSISRFSATRPWRVIVAWIAVIVVAIVSGVLFLSDATTIDIESLTNQDSVVGLELLDERMNYPDPERETIVVHSPSISIDDQAFEDEVNALVADLRSLTELVDPENTINYYELAGSTDPEAAEQAANLVNDERTALIVPVTLIGSLDDVQDHYDAYADTLEKHASEDFEVLSVGTLTLNEAYARFSEEDLQKGESIGVPIALLILILVFGAIVAALVPLGLAVVAIVTAVGMVAFVGNYRELSFFITNMVALIGLAVGIDYSLFVIDRYREERKHGRSRLDAIEEAGNTASKAVLFSGLTVVFALCGLFVMPNSIFRSLGLGAILVVLVAVAAVLTLLPAVIALLGDKLDWPRRRKYDDQAVIEAYKRDAELIHKGFWGQITRVVMRYPWPFVIGGAALLIALSIPYFDKKQGFEGINTMPESDVKTAFELLDEEFAAGRIWPVDIVVDGANTPEVNAEIDALKATLAANEGFDSVGPTVWSPNDDLAHIQAFLEPDPNSEEAYDLVTDLRKEIVPAAFEGTGTKVYVAGDTAFNQDFFDLTDERTPWVFVFVLGLSFVLLMVAFRSIVVPLKAIIMNLLSVGAAYGLLVLVFQKGKGADFFGYTQTETIEAWLPLFLFCVLFGLSMDYQVFLISRIREQYDRTGNNTESVASGLQLTARLITGAAAIMVVVFAGFSAGGLSSLQQMGFGLAVAIAIDATIVRSILVPATMRLLGDWNWYLPSWLKWLPDLRIEGTPRPHTEIEPTIAD